jgi:hypothetical protein
MDFGSFAIPIYKTLYESGSATVGPRNTAGAKLVPRGDVKVDDGRAGLGHAETPSMESCSVWEVSAEAERVQAKFVFWQFGILRFARLRMDPGSSPG